MWSSLLVAYLLACSALVSSVNAGWSLNKAVAHVREQMRTTNPICLGLCSQHWPGFLACLADSTDEKCRATLPPEMRQCDCVKYVR